MRLNKPELRYIFLVWLTAFGLQSSWANGVAVTNVSLVNVGGGTADVQFDLSWSNSWYQSWTDDGGATTITNWDAVWVFVKFKSIGGQWKHALLTSSNHTATGGSQIDIANNGSSNTNLGAFVRRAALGAGGMNCTAMRLKWDYTLNGLGGTNDIDVSVHATEMVYIPEGAYHLGGVGAETYHFYTYPEGGQPYLVSSENRIAADRTAGNLYSTGFQPESGEIAAAFPKGFAAFYCMKYEITQDQYAVFLNHLDPGVAVVRFPSEYGNNRHTIQYLDDKYVADAPDRACNYLSHADLVAYLDWACLRPMTELEFEKTCRGPLYPEPLEFAWGDASYTQVTGFSGTDGSGTETAIPADANSNFDFNLKPSRAGLFAEPGSSRHKAGAGYYGVMELSGNVDEAVVNVHTSEGASYTGAHGDGSLSTAIPIIPGYPGFGLRGGGDTSNYGQVANRSGINAPLVSRLPRVGGRGVRSYP